TVYAEREGLCGIGRDAVGRPEGKRKGPGGTCRRSAAQGCRAVVIVHKDDAAGQGPGHTPGGGGEARGSHHERAGMAEVERGAAGVGDGGSLVDREGEVLGRGRAHAVAGGEGEVVNATRINGGRPAEDA